MKHKKISGEMKFKWYILLVFVLVITAFNYNKTYSFNNPSIKILKKATEKDSVLCLQINISSLEYLDSLIVESTFEDNRIDKKIFVFDKKTRRASVNYFFLLVEKKEKIKFSLTTYNEQKDNYYEKIININEI